MREPWPKWSKSILVVEDDEATREVLMAALQHAGYNVTSASGRTEVMALVRYAPFDLILTDVFMPEMDGTEVIKAVKRYRPSTPVLAMSGGASYMSEEVAMNVAELVGTGILLVKPFHLEELLTAIENALSTGKHSDLQRTKSHSANHAGPSKLAG